MQKACLMFENHLGGAKNSGGIFKHGKINNI